MKKKSKKKKEKKRKKKLQIKEARMCPFYPGCKNHPYE